MGSSPGTPRFQWQSMCALVMYSFDIPFHAHTEILRIPIAPSLAIWYSV